MPSVEPEVDSAGRLTRQGTVSIAPSAWDVPDGRMVDPEASRFWVSWQIHDPMNEEGGVLEDAEIVGADAAIAWGRERADVVFNFTRPYPRHRLLGRARSGRRVHSPLATERPAPGWMVPDVWTVLL